MSLPPLNIKILFHALAILAGVIAGACGLLSSNNRLTLFVTFALIAGIFELAIPFLKLPPVKPPKLSHSITSLPSNYAEGLEIDGVEWKKDYKEYIVIVSNKSNSSEIYDLRIDMDVIGGIVKHRILSQRGCENITFSEGAFGEGGIVKGKVMVETVKSYESNLYVSASKLYPESHFEIKLIVKVLPTGVQEAPRSGFFGVKYRYLDAEGKTAKKSYAHKIIMKDSISQFLHIDTDNYLTGRIRRAITSVLDKPLTFKKDGTIEKKPE